MKKPEDSTPNMHRHYSKEEIVSRLQAIHAFPIDAKDPILTVHSLLELYADVYENIAQSLLKDIEKRERRNFRSNLLSVSAILVCLGSLIFYFILFLEK